MRSDLKSGQDFISRGMEAGERVLIFTAMSSDVSKKKKKCCDVSKDERQDHTGMEWGILSA